VDGHDDMGMETMLEVREGALLMKDKAASGRQNSVAISGFAFEPASITVQAGQAVTRAARSRRRRSAVTPASAWCSTGPAPTGTCALHPEMKGIVVVK
jgi:plastocyanin